MQFCQPHWDALRAAIDARGLSHLVGKNGAVAVERLKREAEGTATPADFDPLMHAHWRIASEDMKVVGLAAMNEGHCPLCSVASNPQNRPGMAEDWINGAADEALAGARHFKLVPEAS